MKNKPTFKGLVVVGLFIIAVVVTVVLVIAGAAILLFIALATPLWGVLAILGFRESWRKKPK